MPIKYKEKDRKPTQKQEKLIRNTIENLGEDDKTLSKGALLKKSGYSPATASNPHIIYESPAVKNGLIKAIPMIEKKARLALRGITSEKTKKASAAANAMTFDILAKNHELLSGRPSQRIDKGDYSDDEYTLFIKREAARLLALHRAGADQPIAIAGNAEPPGAPPT